MSSNIEKVESVTVEELQLLLQAKDLEINQLKKRLTNDTQFSSVKLAFKQLHDFLAMAPFAIYFKNKNLDYTYANQAFATLLGFPVDDLMGINNKQLPSGKNLKALEQIEAKVLVNEEDIRNQEIRISIAHKDVLMNTYVFPIKDELGNIDGVMTCCFDLLERVEFREKLKVEQDKTSAEITSKKIFMANLSHEIRTPLHGILGSGALLKSFLTENQAIELLDNINHSGNSLLKMVDWMLLLEKFEKGEEKIKKDSFNLRHLIDTMKLKHEDQLKVKGIDFQSFVAQGLPDVFKGDAEKIELILSVFLSNAIKFTEKGFVHLFVQAEQNKGKFVRLKFSVKDTGIGIKNNLQKELFSESNHKNYTGSKAYQGSGIGLTMAEKTVYYCGGKIGFESTEQKGSSFWFSLELEKVELGAAFIERIPASNFPVLLVEDNKINQKIAFFTLKKLGFTLIEIAENGLDAVERFQNGDFKIVLMDLQMPIMNGYNATSKIRAFEKFNDLQPSLIVALSANIIKEDVEKCFVVGMNEYISKPFSQEKLMHVIQQHLQIQIP